MTICAAQMLLQRALLFINVIPAATAEQVEFKAVDIPTKTVEIQSDKSFAEEGLRLFHS